MKNYNLFGAEFKPVPEKERKYSTKVATPIYEPKNAKPHVLQLIDTSKSDRLISEIKKSDISEEDKAFLIEAAKRHTVFHYENIADYYAHSSKEVQNLMERSALVIIDFHKAIELGYVKLSEDIQSQYIEDYGE